MKSAKKKTVVRRLAPPKRRRRQFAPRGLSPADLKRFCGMLSEEEAQKMIRDIDQAYEQVDAE